MACSTSDLLIPTRDFYCTFSLCEFLCVHGNKACVCVSANKRGLIGDNGRHCQMSIKSCSFSLSLVCLSRDTYMTAQTSEPSFFLRTSVFFFLQSLLGMVGYVLTIILSIIFFVFVFPFLAVCLWLCYGSKKKKQEANKGGKGQNKKKKPGGKGRPGPVCLATVVAVFSVFIM